MGTAITADRRVGYAGYLARTGLAIIDDDSGFRQVLTRRLESARCTHRFFLQPPSPRSLIVMRAGAVILDLDLAGPARWDYLERLVDEMPGLPIVLCTQPWPVADRVRALRGGAADWIARPCHPDELLARVEAALRARHLHATPRAPRTIAAGELEIRFHQYAAFAGSRDAELTRREFDLLRLLAEAEGQVFEREEIYRLVWGYEMAHGDRSVDVFVRKLRQKLERVSPDWWYIHTHFGVGYRFSAERLPSVFDS